jgi:hypothetical protein
MPALASVRSGPMPTCLAGAPPAKDSARVWVILLEVFGHARFVQAQSMECHAQSDKIRYEQGQ